MIALTAVNIIGVRESARINLVLAATDYATQLLLVALGVFLVLNFGTLIDNIHLGVAPQWDQLAVSIPVAMISYTGLETISNMSEESRSPRMLVPRAYKVLVVAVLSIYALLPAVALSALPVTEPGGELLDPARDKSRATRSSASSSTWASACSSSRCGSTSASWPPRSCSSRRTRARSASAVSPTRSASTSSFQSNCAT